MVAATVSEGGKHLPQHDVPTKHGTFDAFVEHEIEHLKAKHQSSGSAPSPAHPPIRGDRTKSGVLTSRDGGDMRIILVDTQSKLREAIASDPILAGFTKSPDDSEIIAVDFEGVPEHLYLMQVATPTRTYLFDGVALGEKEMVVALERMLTSRSIVKLMHDVHNDAYGVHEISGVCMEGVFDTQLMHEFLHGELHVGFNNMLKAIRKELYHSLKTVMHAKMDQDVDLWSKRPIPRYALQYAAMDVRLLMDAIPYMLPPLTNLKWAREDSDANGATEKQREEVKTTNCNPFLLRASSIRVKNSIAFHGQRVISFDVDRDYAVRSHELMSVFCPSKMCAFVPLEVQHGGVEMLIDLIPDRFRRKNIQFDSSEIERLSDIVLDKGRRPYVFFGIERVFLSEDEDEFVTEDDLSEIVDAIGGDEKFGGDNRAGIERCLHRISRMNDRSGRMYGLTMRAGRSVSGNADMINDIIYGMREKSVLVLGEPGSGKTTIVREIARKLSHTEHVIIVDTSNEIAGDGEIPHPCVGYARRMMVPTLDCQSKVMVECVQNHTPHVMVIDEIGRPTEVDAARTVKQRGVRLIASAHGDLRKLGKNRQLKGLLGGFEDVILPGGVPQTKRISEPTFDVIVEVRRSTFHEWIVVPDVAHAVDEILVGKLYPAQRRFRDPDTGVIRLELMKE
eukprot:TRINITY_DN10315_c0_g1_i1.p1 TRINITY_DN10315_c0_g1~~TRINITY_DN10315_c0_g1_i1.p1  ORF type:complete len:676 (-),score=209.34 TRINITY_DN10315_c0_g1_i1:138-2165(-)